MKVSVDGQELFTLSEIQKKVILNDIPEHIFEEDMIRRLRWTFEHPCDQCYESRKNDWGKCIKDSGASSIPTDKMELAKRFFLSQEVDLDASEDKDMVVTVDDLQRFRITPTHKRMIKLQGTKDVDAHCQDRLGWILKHKYERCMERLRNEWTAKFQDRGLKEVPADDDAFALLVFSQPDYKNRSQREKDEKAKEN